MKSKMKTFVLLFVLCACGVPLHGQVAALRPELAPAVNAAAGSLDSTFNPGAVSPLSPGMVTTDLGGNDYGNAVAVQSDGKIIVVGETDNNFALVRYNPNGSLDTSFGINGTGKVTTLFGASDHAYAVAIQATTGKIVVAGTTGGDFAVARYNSNGTLDPTFNSGAVFPLFPGMVATDYSVSGSGDSGRAVAIQSDGKIVVAGYSYDPNESEDFVLLRYNSNGTLDATFNSGGIGTRTPGIVITPIGSQTEDKAYAIAIQLDGKIIIAGASRLKFALARYTSVGVLDPTFGSGGKVTTDFHFEAAGYSLALKDDKIIVAGDSQVYDPNSINCRTSPSEYRDCTNADFALARYNSNGSLDATFNPGAVSPLSPGMVTTDLNLRGNEDSGRGVAIQTDGKIIVAGYSETSVHKYSGGRPNYNLKYEFSLARYNSNGSLDPTFDTDGKVLTDFAGTIDKGNAVAIQANGKIVIAGYYNFGDFALARYDVGTGGPPGKATLISPRGAISTPTPTYTWNAVSGSTWYWLWVNSGSVTRILQWYTDVEAGCGAGTGTCSVTPSVVLAPGAATYWIETWNDAGIGPWSDALSFTVSGSGGTPGAATLISPSGAITTPIPTYTWNAVSGSTWYYLWVSDGNGIRIQQWYTDAQAGCGTGSGTCSVTPSTPINSAATWWIQTWNNAGYGLWSAGMSFLQCCF